MIQSWTELTEMIYEYEGSLGSRLHIEKEGIYLAYAQWPNRETWENSGAKLPEEAKEVRKRMQEACESIETLYEMKVNQDLLRSETRS